MWKVNWKQLAVAREPRTRLRYPRCTSYDTYIGCIRFVIPVGMVGCTNVCTSLHNRNYSKKEGFLFRFVRVLVFGIEYEAVYRLCRYIGTCDAGIYCNRVCTSVFSRSPWQCIKHAIGFHFLFTIIRCYTLPCYLL